MKEYLRKKSSWVLLFCAIIGLAVVSIGGEYLHSQIHHHQDEASRQECPFFQLLIKTFIFVVTVLAASGFKKLYDLIAHYFPHISKDYSFRLSPRAPPVV